jgi:hypothetical protein
MNFAIVALVVAMLGAAVIVSRRVPPGCETQRSEAARELCGLEY